MMELPIIRGYRTRDRSDRIVQLKAWKFISICVFTGGSDRRDWWPYLVAARRAILG